MRAIGLVLACAAVIALPSGALAQGEAAKLAVQIEASTADPIGRQLVFYLRDEIGRSGTFTEVTPGYTKGFKLEIVTLDPYENQKNAGSSTIYSFVILGNGGGNTLDSYFTSYVGSCVTPQTCARTLFTALGEQAELLRQLLARTAHQKPNT